MFTFSALALFFSLQYHSTLAAPSPQVEATSFYALNNVPTSTTSSYWLSSIKRQGTVAFGDTNFKIFRNVKDFGALGMSVYSGFYWISPFPSITRVAKLELTCIR